MKLRLLLSLSLLVALPVAFAETADDVFYGGTVNYLSNNIPRALEIVTNGRALYPDDIKLKKLEELLRQQQQQKEEQRKQQEKKDQQSKQDQNKEQQKKDEEKKQAEKKEQEKKQDQRQAKQSGEKSQEKDKDKEQQLAAHAMTPQEAKQLLDAQKGGEQVLQFVPQGEPRNRNRILKDW